MAKWTEKLSGNGLEKISDWWVSASPQEKRTLKIALPIILAMVVYLLVVEPVLGVYSARKAEYEEAKETLTWLYDQAPLVGRMKNGCGNRISYMQNGDEPQALAQAVARRSSVSARAEPQSGSDALSITVSSAPGNRLLNYVQSMACNGFDIVELEVKRDADTANASATLAAVPAVLPRQYQ